MRIRGFTLLETLIAMVILAGGLTLLVSAWSGSFMRLRKTQSTYEMALLLERKMGEVETEYRGKPLDTIPEEETGDFGSDFNHYTWKIASKDLEFPDLTSTLTSQEGGADQMTMMVMQQMITVINESVKEVTVSVKYAPPNARSPVENSVTTYFVDYDVKLPGGFQ